ncbi:xanthine dehydrogenase accessory protein XdhC [Rhizobiales bacterium]|uniref:xanthine dehydrogenase accessory protein XdhC n=1 Tax=Hongsoonwoonella zoysiae TaxID=2821844 RepID=UPI00155F8F67|nr:xanthine dehydrogenase accessory protein XdhC [Hongsoonwoonella zoysiae]NRG18814.1 xanthine dehydrogenase accessory protein XdhC [Hongsoonwoonella zoysiae]
MMVWATISTVLERQGSCALVTVLRADGSSPREAGARMIVQPDGSFFGTIGGGNLEYDAIAIAREAAKRGQPGLTLRNFSLGPDLGQCCGGRVCIAIEVVDAGRRKEIDRLSEKERSGAFSTKATIEEGGTVGPREILDLAEAPIIDLDGAELIETFGEFRTELWLFGAGHVGRALVLALAPLPFNVTWIDSRADAFPAMVPANCRCVLSERPEKELINAPDGAWVIVMTYSHALDQAIADTALRRTKIPYVGMIGSRTKRGRMLSRFRAGGIEESALDRFVCPIGLQSIRSKHPAAIAASVAADLLAKQETEIRAWKSCAPLASSVASAGRAS